MFKAEHESMLIASDTGPNTVTGHTSVIFTSEVQIQYILQLIAPVLSGSATSFAVKPAACDAYNTKIQKKIDGGVLTQCVSWYRAGGTGKVTTIFPGPVTQFWWWLRKPVWGDYEVAGGERWRKEKRLRKMAKIVGVGAMMVISVGLSQNWEAVESGAKEAWGIVNDKVRGSFWGVVCITHIKSITAYFRHHSVSSEGYWRMVEFV